MNVPPKNLQHQREIERCLRLLRDFTTKNNRGLHGWDEILAYLAKIGVQNTGNGKPPKKYTVQNWIARKGFPQCSLRKSHGVFTTELHILAWLWSIRVWQKTKPAFRHAPHREIIRAENARRAAAKGEA